MIPIFFQNMFSIIIIMQYALIKDNTLQFVNLKSEDTLSSLSLRAKFPLVSSWMKALASVLFP